MTGEPQRLEDVELRPEADERGHTGGRKHERHHDERQQRIALVQTLEVIEVFGFEALPAGEHEHAERSERHDHVRDRVIQRGFVSGLRARDETEQDEAHVADGRIREHALEIALRDGDHVAEHHRQHGERRQHVRPRGADAAHAVREQPERQRERGELRHRGQEQRYARGRAGVHVGHPHVERHRAELERDCDDEEHETQHDAEAGLPAAIAERSSSISVPVMP